MSRKLVVLLTGTAASVIALAWAKDQVEEVHTVAFDDGTDEAKKSLDLSKSASDFAKAASHEVIPLGGLKGTPAPGSLLFQMAYLANRASTLQAHGIVIGDCPKPFTRDIVDSANAAIHSSFYGPAGTVNHPAYTPLYGLDENAAAGLIKKVSAQPALDALVHQTSKEAAEAESK